MIFCTLFDSKYLDKGLALYHSLLNLKDDFKLYIFCFDDLCYNCLNKMNLLNVILISISDFESENLLKIKTERSHAEYCWTCTPFTIKYVFEHFGEESCTYIDADIYFFSNPKILFDEIPEGKDVMIVSHFFSKSLYDQILEKLYGKYCVQFNYFKNNESGREVLNWWADKCYEWCYAKIEINRMGDQKYLNEFPKKFKQVHECKYRGGGIAPWNFKQFKYQKGNLVLIQNESVEVVFYHFQNLRYINNYTVNINVGKGDKNLKAYLYCKYQADIYFIRKFLETKYNVQFDLKKSYSSNPITKFIRRNLMQYAVRNKNDIITYEQSLNYVRNVLKISENIWECK